MGPFQQRSSNLFMSRLAVPSTKRTLGKEGVAYPSFLQQAVIPGFLPPFINSIPQRKCWAHSFINPAIILHFFCLSVAPAHILPLWRSTITHPTPWSDTWPNSSRLVNGSSKLPNSRLAIPSWLSLVNMLLLKPHTLSHNLQCMPHHRVLSPLPIRLGVRESTGMDTANMVPGIHIWQFQREIHQ